MKLLYLPNEPVLGWQVGARDALESLRRAGALTELHVYSFLQQSPSRALAEIEALVESVRPDAILFTKIAGLPVDDRWLRRVRGAACKPLLAYYDGDVYGRVFKRLPAEARALCRHADLVLLCAMGTNARLFEAAGAKRVAYMPHNASEPQFGAPWSPTRDRELDVVFIGNRIRGRFRLQEKLPFARMPGVYEREELVRRLAAAFGSRFAVYGTGWDGFAGARGPIEFARQHEVLRRAWLSVGFDHFPREPLYFSDRLPIALMSGVAHAVHYHRGYETMFDDGEHLLWAHSIGALVDVARDAIAKGPEYLDALGARGRRHAERTLTSRVVFANAIAEIARMRP